MREKLVDLHQKLLGETLGVNDTELTASYALLNETWQARINSPGNGWAWQWPDENCYFYLEEQWQDGGVSNMAQDPAGMLYSWTSILIYLLTDFSYLHE